MHVPRTRRVFVLAVEACQSLDVLGPVEVFHHASVEVPDAYRVEVVGPTHGDVITAESGMPFGVGPLPEPPPRHDILVVAGGSGARAAVQDPGIVDWVARASRRTCSRPQASSTIAKRPPIGPIARTVPAATPESTSIPIRSSSMPVLSGPRPASQPASTSPWPWSKRTSARRSRSQSRESSSCS